MPRNTNIDELPFEVPDFSWRKEVHDYQYMLPVDPASVDDKDL